MFIQITPEGYTPDGKWRVVPLSATEKMLDAQELIASCSASFAGAISAAPPPPAEMLEYAKKKVMMPADMLAKARRALAHAASGNSMYQQDYDDFCAAIDAARGK